MHLYFLLSLELHENAQYLYNSSRHSFLVKLFIVEARGKRDTEKYNISPDRIRFFTASLPHRSFMWMILEKFVRAIDTTNIA